MKRGLIVLGILMFAFGVGCLNYTNGDGFAHHLEWAQQHALPKPSREIFILGVACTALGAGIAGFAVGRPRKQ